VTSLVQRERPAAARGRDRRTVLVALAVWALLLVVARVWGSSRPDQPELHLDAIPFYGRWDPVATWRLLVPVLVGAAAVLLLPSIAARWPWRRVLVAVALTAIGWSIALATVDGAGGFADIGHAYGDHIGLVDAAGGPAAFLRGYVENQDAVPVHLQAHPPGLVLTLWASARAGLSGPGWETALAMSGVAAAAVATIVVARDVVSERFARRAAPFVVLAPAAVWHTNADVVFGGIALTGVALVVLATGRAGRWRWPLAGAGGAVFGLSLLFAYGVALLAVPIAAVALWRRRPATLVVAAVAGAVVVALPLAWGFWWLDGLAATRVQYAAGVGGVRPYEYFLVANLAVFALALGAATAAGLARLRDRRAWLLVGSGLAVVLLADLSGLSSAETERIWQPFMPLVLLAGAALAPSRRWLAVQVAVAVVLQAALRSPW
jgi:methylthioxylose transferase